MSPTMRICGRKIVYLLACLVLMGFAAPVSADPKALSKEEQAKVDKAVERGVDYLKRAQRDKGDWPNSIPHSYLAQTVLPAYALLEAGVPAKDPVVQKAAEYVRPKLAEYLRSTRHDEDGEPEYTKHGHYHTYLFSLAVLFFDRLGDPKDEKLIRSLALRLIAGQHYSGGWSYHCPMLEQEDEENLLKLVGELSKHLEAGEQPTAKTYKDLGIPKTLRLLTVLQERRKLFRPELKPNRDHPQDDRLYIASTDNSNTQFAMLALWVAQRHGVPARPTFDLMVERFQHTQLPNGWWPYSYNRGPTRSMICVGLLGLAIGRGLKPDTPKTSTPDESRTRNGAASSQRTGKGDAFSRGKSVSRAKLRRDEELRILRGLAALYAEVGMPTGQIQRLPAGYPADSYFLWSVERVGMLYDLPTLGDKEWYRWGAEILVTSQYPDDGRWQQGDRRYDPRKDMPVHYGPCLDTAFALLFLKHSHPMKELTPKLSLKPAELNKGIMALRNAPVPREISSPGSAGTKDRSPMPPP